VSGGTATVPAGNASVRGAPDDGAGETDSVGALLAGGADGTVAGLGGVAAVTVLEAAGTEAVAGAATGLAIGAAAGLAMGAAAAGVTGASGVSAGALAGSLTENADVASATAVFVRRNNTRVAADHADAILDPLLREPPRVFMLHNSFFVA